MIYVIAKVYLKNGNITDVVVRRGKSEEHPDFEGNSFTLPNKWTVEIGYDKITCESSRKSKYSDFNEITYTVMYNGFAKSILKSKFGTKVISAGKVFSEPGNFTGVLNLIYKKNGHRWAEFISTEYRDKLDERTIRWGQLLPEEREFKMRNTDPVVVCSHVDAKESLYGIAFDVLFSGRKGIVTDGAISIVDDGKGSKAIIRDASFVIRVEIRHAEDRDKRKVRATLYRTSHDIVSLVPKAEEYLGVFDQLNGIDEHAS